MTTTRRGHNEGSFYQRKDGRWVAAVSLPDGSRKSLYAKTKREVLAAKRDFELRFESGVAAISSDETVATFLHRWLEDVVRPTLRPRTFQSYESIVRVRIVPVLGRLRLTRLTPPEIQSLYTKLGIDRKLSARSIQYTHQVLHAALKQAVGWNLLIRNPTDAVRAPRPARKELATLTGGQVAELLGAVAATPRFALYSLAVTTGLRRGEILGLRWEDIDFDRSTLSVRRTLQRIPGGGQVALEPKTQRSRRTVALSDFTLEALRRHKVLQAEARLRAGALWQATNAVFSTKVGTPFEGGVISRGFHDDLRAAGLPQMRFHDLRHTCATLLLEGETNPKVVQEMLGHSTITITLDVYSHVLPHMQQRAAAVFDRLLSSDQARPEVGR